MIQHIEELSINAWPSLQTLCYDGWLLRFAKGFTRRANSIYPLYPSREDLGRKITHCEELYRSQHLPVIFKMTPAASPYDLDTVLAGRGYEMEARTSLQVLDLTDLMPVSSDGITVTRELTGEWLEDALRLNKLNKETSLVFTEILSQIIPRKLFISFRLNGETAASGLGVIEDGYLGIFDIIVTESHRHQGHGWQLMMNLLWFARENGAHKAYLQVLEDNLPAIGLYNRLGFKEIYQYWYRVNHQ
jgi:ribosomal protein S18 acetylase RimI-like enzyme